jgi:predicted DNA-binding transcriptional regulator YafY
MRFRVNGLNEIKWWVLSYGDQAVVREPAELRQAVSDIARATAHHYAGG